MGEELPRTTAAHVRHCRAKPCRKIDGKEEWTRTVFCLDRVTLPLEPALEAALLLQRGSGSTARPRRGPLEREASKLLAQMRGEVERLALWSVVPRSFLTLHLLEL